MTHPDLARGSGLGMLIAIIAFGCITQGAPVQSQKSKKASPQLTAKQRQALNSRLWEAFRYKDVNKMRDLIRQGADVNVLRWTGEPQYSDPRTMLTTSVRTGDVAMVRALIGMGANYLDHLEPADSPTSALFLAFHMGHRRLADLFLEQKAVTPKVIDDNGLLHDAAIRGDLEFVELLVSKGASLARRHTFSTGIYDEGTPLHFAAENGHLKVIEKLLGYGADIDARDINGQTPLYSAARGLQVDAVKLLLRRGAKVTVRDGDGRTVVDVLVIEWLDMPPEANDRAIDILRLLIDVKTGRQVLADSPHQAQRS
jgi:ankyrin repeat protein